MRKSYGIKRIAAVCTAFLLTIGILGVSNDTNYITGSADQEQYDSQLEELKKQQESLEKKISEADKKIADEGDNLQAITDKYDALKKQIENVKAQSSKLEKEMVTLDTKLRETQVELDKQNEAIDKSQADFMERIRAMYVAGTTESYTNVLINSTDFYDVLMRLELVKRVASHDNDELNKLIEAKKKIEATKVQINKQTKELKKTAEEYADKQSKLTQQQKELLELKKQSAAAIKKLSQNKEKLNDKSSKLAEEYKKVSSLAATTTTTTTTTKKTTTKKTTTKKAKTTKKTSEGKPSSSTTQRTTQAPQTTTSPNQTNSPAQTTTKPSVPDTSYDSDKIDIVLSYAKSNVGGAYVWGGSSFRATDCSGLVMLSYGQIGISLPHLASSQANYGTTVSYDSMKPGDVIFFGGSSYSSIYHVAIYIGNGNMVHAQNSATGIVISNVASFSMYNNITVIKRLI